MSEIIERLRRTADMFAVEERPTFMPGASAEAIAAMERCLPAPLAGDFAEFLRTSDAVKAMDIWNGYWIGGVSDLMRSISRGDFPSSVATEHGPDSVVPVATDGGGNAFLLSVKGDTVWRWDHETGGVRVVAASFTAFLERVLEDWEHYLSGDGTWQYL